MFIPSGYYRKKALAALKGHWQPALLVALILFKASPKYIVKDGTRLMDNVGPIGILPQLLSALGALFTAAGVGTVIANGVSAIIPEGSRLIACAVSIATGIPLVSIVRMNFGSSG